MPIRIISIGKKPSAWLKQGLEGYQKRLKRPFNVKWSILPNSPSKGLKSRQDEAKSIIGLLNSDDYVILLDESGKNIDSVALSRLMENQLNKSKNIAFIIGGCVYIFMVFKNRRVKALFLFLSPIILAIASFIAVQLIRHPGSFYWYRFHQIPLYIVRLFDSYRDLEKILHH